MQKVDELYCGNRVLTADQRKKVNDQRPTLAPLFNDASEKLDALAEAAEEGRLQLFKEIDIVVPSITTKVLAAMVNQKFTPVKHKF